MEEIKQWVLEEMQKRFPNDSFYWKKEKRPQFQNGTLDGFIDGETLYGIKNVKREDYSGWPEDTWFDLRERMKDIECVRLTQLLIDDLQQYNGILVKEEILKSAMFEFDRFRIY